jgi:hypothetical protein
MNFVDYKRRPKGFPARSGRPPVPGDFGSTFYEPDALSRAPAKGDPRFKVASLGSEDRATPEALLMALHRIASHGIAWHRIALHRIASHRIASHRTA